MLCGFHFNKSQPQERLSGTHPLSRFLFEVSPQTGGMAENWHSACLVPRQQVPHRETILMSTKEKNHLRGSLFSGRLTWIRCSPPSCLFLSNKLRRIQHCSSHPQQPAGGGQSSALTGVCLPRLGKGSVPNS